MSSLRLSLTGAGHLITKGHTSHVGGLNFKHVYRAFLHDVMVVILVFPNKEISLLWEMNYMYMLHVRVIIYGILLSNLRSQ